MLVAATTDGQPPCLNDDFAVLLVSRCNVRPYPSQDAKAHRPSPVEKHRDDVGREGHQQRETQGQMKIEPELDQALQLDILL